MTETLSILESHMGRRGAQILAAVKNGIETGRSLSAACGESGEFPPFFLSMLSVGEKSGTLPEQLLSLALYYEKEQAFRRQIAGALSYPLFVLLFAAIMCGLILTVILPSFSLLFNTLGIEMPLPARIALHAGLFLRAAGPYLLLLILTAILGLSLRLRSAAGRLAAGSLLLRSHFLRRLLLIRFAQALAALLRSGTPLTDALAETAPVMGNARAAAAIREVRAQLNQGGDFPAALTRSGFALPLLTRMISAGMESGELPQFLTHAARLMTEETETRLTRFKAVAEPLLITGAGLLTAAVVASVMLPLFSAIGQGLR